MQCFPQLLTGAVAQYPLRKRTVTRTICNNCLDGRDIKLVDPAGSSTEWQLTFAELTDAEASSLEQFFLSMEGPLNAFTFLDPTANLLEWSNQFDQPAWQADPLLKVTGSIADRFGGAAGWQLYNPAGASQRLQQTLNAPAANYYAFSLWARADLPGKLTLHRGDQSQICNVGPDWCRLVLAADSPSTDLTVAFSVELTAGATVDIYGAQAEAQIGASGYKPTTSIAGVYPNARFAQNALAFTTLGPGRHGCLIQLRTN